MMEVVPEDDPLTKAVRMYERLNPTLEPDHAGEFLAVDVEMDAYAVSADPIVARDELRARGSRGRLALFRVGSMAAYEML